MITRRSITLALGAAAFGAVAASAQEQKQASKAAAPPPDDATRRPVAYTVPDMDRARVREGLVYKTADGTPLNFDLYSPAVASAATPAVILIHGGPVPTLGARRWGMFVSYGRILAAMGMIGIAFDHRLLGADRLRDSTADLADLVRHLREQAGAFGIDSNRMALWSFSGGGSLIAAALRERQSWWKQLVVYYGIMEPFGNDKDERLSAIAALGKDASKAPPILMARAGLDNPAINSTIDRFVATANSAGATLDLLTHPTGHHAFDILDPGERTAQIIQRTLGALNTSLALR